MSIASVVQLGAEIEARWRAADYALHLLPGLATRALAEVRLLASLHPDEIVEWALSGDELPQQPDPTAKFGQPPVTLFRGRRSHIDALFWVDGTTTIHQHGFSGAFQVLSGSSIETRYAFDSERSIDGRFLIGKLRVASTSFLRPGDIRPIESGSRLIHALFHLERPSITIVVRSFSDADAGPQYDYALPGIGHDPFFMDVTRDRALQLVGMLRTTEHPRFEGLVGDLIERSDLHSAYRVLRECASLPDVSMFERLIARVRDASAADMFRQAFEENRRIAFLRTRRNLVKDPELRFFLGVLLNAHRRQDVLTLVSERDPGVDAAKQVAACLRRLSEVTVKLQAAGIPWQPNLLGLPAFTDELEAFVAQFVAGGERRADTEAGRAFMGKLQAIPALACLFA
ncbi:MAG TPA: hypothetical protein VMT03_13005 [Polyangia bacterium]|nr:hypothetical protein [Polyangia bacterium]